MVKWEGYDDPTYEALSKMCCDVKLRDYYELKKKSFPALVRKHISSLQYSLFKIKRMPRGGAFCSVPSERGAKKFVGDSCNLMKIPDNFVMKHVEEYIKLSDCVVRKLCSPSVFRKVEKVYDGHRSINCLQLCIEHVCRQLLPPELVMDKDFYNYMQKCDVKFVEMKLFSRNSIR